MKRAGALKPNELMALCRESGKGGDWEPEAIEHWRWLLRNGEGKERVLAWVKLHSIARKRQQCVDEAGHALRMESCAADLGLAMHTVQNHCTVLVAEGRIRVKKTQLWYRADVPENLPEEASSPEAKKSCVHGNFPAYVIDFYEKQSAEKRTEIDTALGALVDWRKAAFLEGLAGLRHEISRIEVSTLRSLGVPKIEMPKKAAQAPVWFQPMLMDEPSFVHGNGSALVSKTVNTATSGGVQSGPTLLPSIPDQKAMKSSPPSPTETSVSEVVMVASRIEGLNVETAARLLRSVRAVEPSLRALEVVHLAEAKLRASPGAHSPIGLLLKKLAQEAVGPPLARAREAARREEERTFQDAAEAAEKEAQFRTEAEEILSHPEAHGDTDVEWARGVLARARGAGDAN